MGDVVGGGGGEVAEALEGKGEICCSGVVDGGGGEGEEMGYAGRWGCRGTGHCGVGICAEWSFGAYMEEMA